MKNVTNLIGFFFVLKFQSGICFFDAVTIGIAGVIGIGTLSFNTIKEHTYCSYVECCNEKYITGDIEGLRRKLNKQLFGQHIVLQQLIPALEAHFSPSSKSRKPLVISFHGTPGTGKNFVADQVAESIFLNGMKSKYVHKYLGRADFPLASKINQYKQQIIADVRRSISDCPRSLFIFDEVDKMPPGIFESITSVMDYNAAIADTSKAIFIFLSNTAGVQIADVLGNMMMEGVLRKDVKVKHFEQILQKAAYNLEGGMKKTSLIEAHVIDHYLPFLPLEKNHVMNCLKAEFNRWNVDDPKMDVLEDIVNNINFDKHHGLFATSGCKTLEKKVAIEVMSLK